MWETVVTIRSAPQVKNAVCGGLMEPGKQEEHGTVFEDSMSFSVISNPGFDYFFPPNV